MKREYKNPFENPGVIKFYHNLGEKEKRQDREEFIAIVAAIAMITVGSLVVLLGLAWYFI